MANFLERVSQLSPKKLTLLASHLQDRLDSIEKSKREPIAVIGIGCRFPGEAGSPDTFWRLLHDGVDGISEVPPGRWDLDSIYDPEPGKPGKSSSRYGGFLSGVDQFDPAFFGISPREAESMDPQQRLLLEVAWEALEDAGQAPDKLAGSRTGVFVGVCNSDYAHMMLQRAPETFDLYMATGCALSVASGRLSYLLGLQGPSISVDTACSSSLVAVHLACQSIRSGETNMAIAAGVNLIWSPNTTIALSRAGMMASDGRCKAFDSAGDGFVRSEGCGVVVLKKLSDALANRDRILALVRGTAANQDGKSSGLTAPNGPSQEAVIRAALAAGGVEPSAIDYIETHGTGTPLGDPIEVRALGNVFGPARNGLPELTIGSVKTNIGHLESSAGIAGFIKSVLALQHEEIPRSLHFQHPNPDIPWDQYPIVAAVAAKPWMRGARPRLCGVSSFGFSGTNAHAVLEEAPPVEQPVASPERPAHVFTVSAKSATALMETVKRHAQALSTGALSLAGACYTAATGRTHFQHRVACVCRSVEQLRAQLTAFAAAELEPGTVSGTVRGSDPTEVVFLFPGQGSQYPGMTRELYRTEFAFRRALDRCAEALAGRLEKPLLEVMFGSGEAETSLHDPIYAQPANFAVEYAASEMWRSWGITPSAVVGHSLGEFAAACVAGMCSPEDAIRLVSTRGRLMQELPPTGAMAVVHESESRVSRAIAKLGGKAAVAAVNHPQQTVVSGPRASVDAVAALMQAEGVEVEWLRAYHGYHSPEMQSMAGELVRAARETPFSAPAIQFVSTMTGKPLPAGMAIDPEYWGRQVVEPVDFVSAVNSLRDLRYRVFLDVGPAPVLGGMGRHCFPEGLWLATLRPGREDWDQALEALAALHVAGVAINWEAFDRPYPRRRIALPPSVFERQRYWAFEAAAGLPSPVKTARLGSPVHPLLGVRMDHPLPTFEASVDLSRTTAFGAHRIGDVAVVPGPVYFEMALAAAAAVLGPGPHSIEDLVIKEALVIDDGGRTVQTVLIEDGPGMGDFQVCSRSNQAGSGVWRQHVSARIQPARTDELPHEPLDQAKMRCPETVSLDALREQFRAAGIEIAAVDLVDRAWKGHFQVLAHLRLPAGQTEQRAHYYFHPAAADAAMLSFATLLSSSGSASAEGGYVLAGVERVQVLERPGGQLWSYARLRPVDEQPARRQVGDLFLYNEAGGLVAVLQGLQFQRADKAALAVSQSQTAPAKDWFYKVEWEPAKPPAGNADGAQRSSVELASEQLPSKAASLFKQYQLEEYAEASPELDRACAGYIVNALLQLGWDCIPGDRVRPDGLRSQLGVAGKYDRLFDRLLNVLAEEGILAAAAGTSREVKRRLENLHPDSVLAGLKERHPRLRPQINLLEKCGRRLGEVLRSELDPLNLLFEGGSHAEVEALYKDSPSSQAFNTLVRDAIASFLAVRRSQGPFRVLEIGAGTGGTSAFVLPVLPGQSTEYVFTDLSSAFLDRAREKFAAYPFVRYEILDIERDPQAQGFPAGSFDLVIAANVLHATSDIGRSLTHARSLLAPGGTLALLEVTGVERWVDLTFGLTEGWWKVSDPQCRTAGPTLSAPAWSRVLEETSFRSAVIPDHVEKGLPPAALIIAEPLTKAVSPASRWIVFSAADETGAALVEALGQRNIACSTVSPGERFARGNDQFTIDPHRPEDYARAIAEAAQGSPSEIVFLWGLDTLGEGATAEVTELSTSAAYLVQAAAAANAKSRLWLVTRGAQAASGADLTLACGQTALWGLGRVIALEEPEIWGGLLDLDPRELPSEQAAWILQNTACGDGEDQVAVRDGSRLAARLARVPSISAASIRVDSEGSYLVTGGLGALGIKIARWLVERGARHLVLMGRRGLPERALWPDVDPAGESARGIGLVRELEALGAQVEIAAVDVSDRLQMEALFSRFNRDWPALHGIVHAAVAPPSERQIRDLDQKTVGEMLSAKVDGTRNLLEVSGHQPLDFVVLFSSMAGILGLNGGAHYAAASQYLDALAHSRRSAGAPVTSINWGAWDEMRSPTGEIRRILRAGSNTGSIQPMSASDALEAMETAMASGMPQVGIAAIDWEALEMLRNSRRPRPLTSRLVSAGKKASSPRGHMGVEELRARLSAASPREQRDVLVGFLRTAVGRALGIRNPQSIDPDKRLFEMGLDSLMSIDLKSQLERAVGERLPTTLTFNYPTIAAMADYLGERLLGQPAVQSAPSPQPRSAAHVAEARDDKRELLAGPGGEGTANSGQTFELSLGQEALCFLHELAPQAADYNVACCGRLRLAVDSRRLDAAFVRLLDRHEMLRCTFETSAESPRQRVCPVPNACLEIVDASGWSEDELKTRVQESYRRPFDLANGPVFRASLFSRNATDHVLLLVAHHVVVDAWSLGIIVSELATLYDRGAAITLPPLQASYADFVKRQRGIMESAAGREAWDYWRTRLEGSLTPTDLPADRARPAVRSFHGGTYYSSLPPSLCARLRALARAQNATPFMVLAAAFHALLHRYTGSAEVSIGTLLAGRTEQQFENIVGYFVNPVVLCSRVEAETTFQQHLAHMREIVIGAQQHGDFPFLELVKRLQPARDTSRTPLFQVMLNMMKTSQIGMIGDVADLERGSQLQLGSLALDAFPLSQQEGQFDLDLTLIDTGADMALTLKYSTDLFEKGTIERMAGHFATLLSAAVDHSDLRIADLPLLTAGERTQVLEEWNATGKTYPETTISQLIEQQVGRNPAATALVCEGRPMSYGELNRRANQLARHLRDMGVGPEVLVGICMERSFEMVVGLLGILKAGGAYVPVDPGYPADRQAYMIEDSGAAVLLTQARLAPSLANSGARLVFLDAGWEEIARHSGDDLEPGAEPDSLAYVIYTSGSTGKPKGAMNTHRAVCNRLLWMQDEYGLTGSDRVLQKTPFSFDVSVWEFFWPLITGARLVIAVPGGHRDPAYLVRLIEEQAITTVHFVPSMLRVFLEAAGASKCDTLQRVLCSGEALSYELQEHFFELLGAGLHNLYGPTEAAVDVTYWACQRTNPRKVVPIGKPVANTQIYILDDRLNPVPVGMAGELYIGGVQVGRGYWRRPQLTAERFIRDPFRAGGRLYRTGDLARWLPEGVIEYLGRNDYQVKVRGLRIELGEIETVLSTHPAVAQAVVVAHEATPGDQRLVAYLTARGAEAPDAADLKAFLSTRLPDYMSPSVFIRLDSFPLTPSGKVDRKALPQPETASPSPATLYQAPRTEVEAAITAIWKEMLRVEKVGINENFFDLGGHSLLLIQVQARIEQYLKRKLAVVELFQYPTIEALARHLTSLENAEPERERIEKQAGLQKRAMRRLRDLRDGKEALR
jgi:amino acid adenylation domain-containing protein